VLGDEDREEANRLGQFLGDLTQGAGPAARFTPPTTWRGAVISYSSIDSDNNKSDEKQLRTSHSLLSDWT
jgi:hypothetical protein